MSARPAARSARRKPHKVRGRELVEVREKDPDGRIVVHHRTVDTLSKMLRAGTIEWAMHDAAQDFQASFIVAQLDPLRALPIPRVPGTRREPDLNERQLHARRRVHKAMAALGGISSPAGSCVWHVVGLQRSVREWAMRQGWGGRPVRQEQAQGILVAGLRILAGHFGYGEARRPPERCYAPWATASGSDSRSRNWQRRPPSWTQSRRRAGGALQLAIMRHEEAGNLLEELVEYRRSLSEPHDVSRRPG